MNKFKTGIAAMTIAVAGLGIGNEVKAQTKEDLTMAMNTSKAPTEVVEKYGNYADKLTDKDIREAAIKRVEAGKKEIPEADKAKFEKVARIAIQDVNEGIGIGVEEIAKKNDCSQYEDPLIMVANGFYRAAKAIIQKAEKLNTISREKMMQKFQEGEKTITSLRLSNQPIEEIKKEYGPQLLTLVKHYKDNNYKISKENYERLTNEVKIPTEGLKYEHNE